MTPLLQLTHDQSDALVRALVFEAMGVTAPYDAIRVNLAVNEFLVGIATKKDGPSGDRIAEDDEAETRAQLTAVAHERAGYERCAARAEEVAAAAFIAGRSEIANAQRALAVELREWAKDAAKRQRVILAKLHPDLYGSGAR